MRKYRCKKIIVNNNINEIDYDKLAEAIVKAKQIEEENTAKKKAEDLALWRKSIGANDYEDKNGIQKTVLVFLNKIKVIFNLIFFSKKKKVVVSMTGAFMQSITSLFFHFAKVVLWILAAAFVIAVFYHPNMLLGFFDYVQYIVFAIVAFILASIFRLMAIETEQITDRERLLGVFTAVMSVIPMIESVVSFLRR